MIFSACYKTTEAPVDVDENAINILETNIWKLTEYREITFTGDPAFRDSFNNLEFIPDCERDDLYKFGRDSAFILDNTIKCPQRDSIEYYSPFYFDTLSSPWHMLLDTSDYELIEWSESQFKLRNISYPMGTADSVYIYKKFETAK